MVSEDFNDEKYLHMYRSNAFSIPLYRDNQNMIGSGISLFSLTHFLSSKVGLFFTHCEFWSRLINTVLFHSLFIIFIKILKMFVNRSINYFDRYYSAYRRFAPMAVVRTYFFNANDHWPWLLHIIGGFATSDWSFCASLHLLRSGPLCEMFAQLVSDLLCPAILRLISIPCGHSPICVEAGWSVMTEPALPDRKSVV
jgi:hypothetical protein